MANCSTSRWVSTAPYVTLTVNKSSETDTTYTVSWSLVYRSDSAANTDVSKAWRVNIDGSVVQQGMFDIDGKTGSHTIAACPILEKSILAYLPSISLADNFSVFNV